MNEPIAITQSRSTDGLCSARAERDNRMELSVRVAIASVIQEGTVPSFYNVAQRARIARSTLYRKQELRALVESARKQAADAKNSQIDPYAELLEENARLWHEVNQLRGEVKRLSRVPRESCGPDLAPCRFEYAVVEFPFAA